MESGLEQVQRVYARGAASYDRVLSLPDRLLFNRDRLWVTGQARGLTVEVAIGTGRNLHGYRSDVRVLGLDASPEMLAHAVGRVRTTPLRLLAVAGDAEHLPIADACADTVVSTLAMCTIPSPHDALAETFRVLRPGGILLLLDHVRSSVPLVLRLQHLLAPLALRSEGDHLLRNPVDHLAASGFIVEAVERHAAGLVQRVRARKPLGAAKT